MSDDPLEFLSEQRSSPPPPPVFAQPRVAVGIPVREPPQRSPWASVLALPSFVQAILVAAVLGGPVVLWCALFGTPTILMTDDERAIYQHVAGSDGIAETVDQIRPTDGPAGVKSYFVRTNVTILGSPGHRTYLARVKNGRVELFAEWPGVKW